MTDDPAMTDDPVMTEEPAPSAQVCTGYPAPTISLPSLSVLKPKSATETVIGPLSVRLVNPEVIFKGADWTSPTITSVDFPDSSNPTTVVFTVVGGIDFVSGSEEPFTDKAMVQAEYKFEQTLECVNGGWKITKWSGDGHLAGKSQKYFLAPFSDAYKNYTRTDNADLLWTYAVTGMVLTQGKYFGVGSLRLIHVNDTDEVLGRSEEKFEYALNYEFENNKPIIRGEASSEGRAAVASAPNSEVGAVTVDRKKFYYLGPAEPILVNMTAYAYDGWVSPVDDGALQNPNAYATKSLAELRSVQQINGQEVICRQSGTHMKLEMDQNNEPTQKVTPFDVVNPACNLEN